MLMPRNTSNIAPRSASRSGFTLVELLVVVGIIALLVGILMPTLNRAREHSRQLKCLSNVRQISMAFVMYTNNNKGRFPFRAPINTPSSEDWIYWQDKPVTSAAPFTGRTMDHVDNPDLGGIMPYLGTGKFLDKVEYLVC